MPPTITEAFPPLSLDEVVELVRGFTGLELADRKAVIKRLVAVHPTISLEWGLDWRYKRARRLSGPALPETVDELIWRKDVEASLGRANPEGFQVLYLADRMETALQEARVIDDAAVISDFRIQEGHSVRVAPIGELAQIHRTGRGYLSGDTSKVVQDMLNACDIDEARSLLITDAFLLDCFVGHDDYELSSHVAMSIFDKNPNVSVVAYPSRRQIGAVNFAVRVETFWQDWGLVMVRHGQARHLAHGFFKLNDVKRVDGIYNSGQLRWADAPEGERIGYLLDPLYVPLPDPG